MLLVPQQFIKGHSSIREIVEKASQLCQCLMHNSEQWLWWREAAMGARVGL
jgi:hypothetical protein